MTFKHLGKNRITIDDQLQLIKWGIQQKQDSLGCDTKFVANFKKTQSIPLSIATGKTAPFWSLGTYFDFAMFDADYGYYTNKVKIGTQNTRHPSFYFPKYKTPIFLFCGCLVFSI